MALSVFTRMAARADRLLSRAALTAAAAVVARAHDLPAERVLAPPSPAEQAQVALSARGLASDDAARITRARQEALYLASTVFGRGQRSLARAGGVHHQTVRKALAAVEDRRDDARYDSALDRREVELMGGVV